MTDDSGAAVTLELTAEEALVLLAWLDSTDAPGSEEETPLAAAARRVYLDIECMLEASLVAPFEPDYQDQLDDAIDVVRDAVRDDFEQETLVLPATDDAMSLVSWIHDQPDTHVEEVDYGEQVVVEFYGRPERIAQARSRAGDSDGGSA